ncbi:MAG: HPP family protein [Quisquiliibacterium sp.]
MNRHDIEAQASAPSMPEPSSAVVRSATASGGKAPFDQYADDSGSHAREHAEIAEAGRVPEAGPLMSFRMRHALAAWLGAFVVIAGTWNLFEYQDLLFAFASLGGSTVVLFSMPESRMAQPRSLFGGHAISAVIGLLMLGWFGANTWTIAAAVATALAVMQLTGTTHAPAGANPIIIMSSAVSAPVLMLNLGVGLLVLWLVAVVLLNGLSISPYCRYVHRQLLDTMRRLPGALRSRRHRASSGSPSESSSQSRSD